MHARTSKARHPIQVALSVPITRIKETSSTNAHAKDLALTGRLGISPICFVAETQSAGVGRFGREWVSPKGGLWLTLAWPTTESDLPEILEGLGLRIGVACLRVVQRIVASGARRPIVKLKWPNDIMLAGHKVLGELTEVLSAPSNPWLIVGVGINANFPRSALPESLRATATTLHEELGHDVDLKLLESDLLSELSEALATKGLPREILDEAGQHLHALNRDIAVSLPDGSRATGVLRGLNEHGMAVLETDSGPFVPPLGSAIML